MCWVEQADDFVYLEVEGVNKDRVWSETCPKRCVSYTLNMCGGWSRPRTVVKRMDKDVLLLAYPLLRAACCWGRAEGVQKTSLWRDGW